MAEHRTWWALGLLWLATLTLVGCATQARYYSSAVDYLYPKEEKPVEKPTIPEMMLPIKVGMAFVPDMDGQRRRDFWQTFLWGKSQEPTAPVLTEKQKMDLMQATAEHFKQYPTIGSIELIPSAYLRPGGSFSNLDQLQTMYGIDAVALLAYDQVQFTDEGAASLLYWTLVGAYVIPGEKNTTQTMMDAVVYHIKSRKMLFRAPGVSQVKGRATPANLTEELRQDSAEGFQSAAENMITNLDLQLALFQDKVKEHPEEYKVAYRSGYTGGGKLEWGFLLGFGIIAGFAWLRRSPE